MHERRRVHELERLREIQHDLVIARRPEARRKEHERRAQELPRRAEQVLHRGGEGRMATTADLE